MVATRDPALHLALANIIVLAVAVVAVKRAKCSLHALLPPVMLRILALLFFFLFLFFVCVHLLLLTILGLFARHQ